MLFSADQASIDQQCQDKFLQKEHKKKKQTTKSERRNMDKKRSHHQIWEGVAREPIINENNVPQVDIGTMTVICKHCGALHWPKELMVRYFNVYESIYVYINKFNYI